MASLPRPCNHHTVAACSIVYACRCISGLVPMDFPVVCGRVTPVVTGDQLFEEGFRGGADLCPRTNQVAT